MGSTMPDHATDPSDPHRRGLLRLLLVFTLFFGVIFITINIAAGRYGLAVVEMIVCSFAATLLTIEPRTTHLRRWSLLYLITLYTGTMFAYAIESTSITVYSWVMVMPIVAHLLLGRWLGGTISAFYVLLSIGLFIQRFGSDTLFANPGAVANIATVTACAYLFAHVYEASRKQAERKLSLLAMTDSLTGLANRVQLEQAYDHACQTQQLPLSLVMFDLDHFKRINDDHGHDTGDAVLRTVADGVNDVTRPADLACRLGGEEFCLLLPDTPLEEAALIAERLRRQIETTVCRHREAIVKLTASIGVASASVAPHSLDRLLHSADPKRYQAKTAGRNRIAVQIAAPADRRTTAA